jgi:hypothetical protein
MVRYKTVIDRAASKGFATNPDETALECYYRMCEIQKWLRDVHEVLIIIGRFSFGIYNYTIVPKINKSHEGQFIKRSGFIEEYTVYEIALTDAIYEALNLIP